ncbi:FAD-dependent oxidoreductase [Moraxella marmotae]|uniref:FAD-dependent oxidoreductase n=1 Tax=Moraxella marmotae TaxID=3344520 RepID=UPI0035F4BDD1
MAAPSAYLCRSCGYVYDAADGGDFDDLPNGWSCPLCHVGKDAFEKVNDSACNKPATDGQRAGVVIIGAGLAGWSVVDAIRANDDDLPITLISADHADRYHKPMLSVAISQNKTPEQLIRSAGSDAALAANITLLANTTVKGIDHQAKTLTTTQGSISYDKLVLAIGAKPNYPTSVDSATTYHVNHLQDFAKLQARLSQGVARVGIIGAGMIGLELAEDLTQSGHQVSLIDTLAAPLASMLPPVATARISHAMTELGVQLLTCCQIISHISHDNTAQLTLRLPDDSSQTLDFDVLIVSTGLIVDDTLPVMANLDFDPRRGISVDDRTLQTSQPDIYAIGDCIAIGGVPCRYVAPHRPQAAAIANHILTGVGNYQHKPPMIRLKNKSITITANGLPTAQGNWCVVGDSEHELSLEMLGDDGQTVIAKALLKTPSE